MKYHITIWENKYVLPKVNLCHQKCGIDLLIMQKRKIIYYNLRKVIFSFSFCIKGKSMPLKLWSWNDRNFDQKRSKLFYMDRTFLLFAKSKSMPPKLCHGFTRRFQWKIILQFARVNPCHQNCGMALHGNFNEKLYYNLRELIHATKIVSWIYTAISMKNYITICER
jgi:hypothetical protein